MYQLFHCKESIVRNRAHFLGYTVVKITDGSPMRKMYGPYLLANINSRKPILYGMTLDQVDASLAKIWRNKMIANGHLTKCTFEQKIIGLDEEQRAKAIVKAELENLDPIPPWLDPARDEASLRRWAKRKGYRLEKCPFRNLFKLGYGTFRLVDSSINRIVFGGDWDAFGKTLEEVHTFLSSPEV